MCRSFFLSSLRSIASLATKRRLQTRRSALHPVVLDHDAIVKPVKMAGSEDA
jgi:hypothetical protein